MYRTDKAMREIYNGNSSIAPPAQNLMKTNNKGLKKHQLRWNKTVDDFNKIDKYDPNLGRVTFSDNDCHKYSKKVAGLTYECLIRINDELYQDAFNEIKVEDLCWKLAAIPSFVKGYNKKTKDVNKNYNYNTRVNQNENKSNYNSNTSTEDTLEEGEIHPKIEEKNKTKDLIEVNKTEVLSSISKKNSYYKMIEQLCKDRTYEITAKQKRMLDALIGKGKISDASKRAHTICTDNNESFDNDVTFQKLLDCHKHDEKDELIINNKKDKEQTEREDYSIFLSSEDELGEIITSMNGHSSAGANGWSVYLLKMIISQNHLILKELMNFINGLIAREWYPEFLFVGRVIAINKNDPKQKGKIRPICITDMFRKLIAKVLLHLHQRHLMFFIPSEQFGVGTRHGSTIISSLIEHTLDDTVERKDSCFIVQTDIDSAFPSVSRQMLIDSLVDVGAHNSFVSFVYQSFVKENLMYFEGKDPQHIPCSKGVAQGCVLSPLLFSLATRKVLEKANIGKNKVKENSIKYPPKCVAYLDDMFFITNNLEEMQYILKETETELNNLGMSINASKSKSLIIQGGEISKESQLYIGKEKIEAVTKLKVLGTLISKNIDDRLDYFNEKVKKSLEIILSVSKIHLQSFMHIVRNCITTKLIHLIRSMIIPKELLYDYDDIIQSIISKTLQLSKHYNKDLINCPMSKGGLGIPALSDIQSLSITTTQQYVCNQVPYLNVLATELKTKLDSNNNRIKVFPKTIPNFLFDSTKNEFGVLKCYVHLQQLLTQDQIEVINSKGQHGMWLELSEDKYQNILMDLSDEMKITIQATASTESSAWLRVLPYAPYQKMKDEEYKESVFNRIGVDNSLECSINKMRRAKIYFDRCPKCGSKMGIYHYSCCKFTQSTRSARHHCLKLLLSQFLREVPGIYVKVEDTTALTDEARETRKVPDIVVTVYDQNPNPTVLENKYIKDSRKTSTFFEFGIDITIPEDHAVKHHKEAKEGKLTDKAEKLKEDIYKEFTSVHGLKVLPFVITSNGKYGKIAKDILKFMREICKRNKIIFPKSQLEERISLLLETSRFQMKDIYYKEMDRLTAQGELRNAKKAHITLPKLSDELNMNYSNSYWKTQLQIASHLLSGKDPVKLQMKVEEEKEMQKFNYTPNKSPPPDPPEEDKETEDDDENNIFINNCKSNSKSTSIDSNNTQPINMNENELENNNNKNISNNYNNNYNNDEEIILN